MTDKPIMTPSRPYLVRALYEWIIDNGMTPLIVVDANAPDAEVPVAFVEDGRMILNISMTAVQGLELGDRYIHFRARFGGVPQEVVVPVAAVLAIYARENSAGMMFPGEDGVTADPSPSQKNETENSGATGSGVPHLRVIK